RLSLYCHQTRINYLNMKSVNKTRLIALTLFFSLSNSALVHAQSAPNYTTPINLDQVTEFPDVKSGSPYFMVSKFLKAHQIIEGYPDGTFQPNKPINRAEALKILNRAFNFQHYSPVEKPLSSLQENSEDTLLSNCQFPDVYNDQWYYNYVCTAF